MTNYQQFQALKRCGCHGTQVTCEYLSQTQGILTCQANDKTLPLSELKRCSLAKHGSKGMQLRANLIYSPIRRGAAGAFNRVVTILARLSGGEDHGQSCCIT
jgi:hypothetical protein